MRIKNIHHTKKGVIAAVAVIILLALTGFLTVQAVQNLQNTKSNEDTNSVDYESPTEQQIENGASIKEDSINNLENTGDDKPSNSVSITMTSANQNADLYQVRFQIDTNVSDGVCTITLSKGDKTLTQTAGVQVNNQISSCKGFNIPINSSNLTPGVWQLTLSFEGSDISGSTSNTIKVE